MPIYVQERAHDPFSPHVRAKARPTRKQPDAGVRLEDALRELNKQGAVR